MRSGAVRTRNDAPDPSWESQARRRSERGGEGGVKGRGKITWGECTQDSNLPAFTWEFPTWNIIYAKQRATVAKRFVFRLLFTEIKKNKCNTVEFLGLGIYKLEFKEFGSKVVITPLFFKNSKFVLYTVYRCTFNAQYIAHQNGVRGGDIG